MSRLYDRGAVLLNALVVVLAISATAAALMTRSETARIRGAASHEATQLILYLDGIEKLVPQFIDDLAGGAVHRDQAWATGGLNYPIDRGAVALAIDDQASKLNVNWLSSDDEFVTNAFSEVFAAQGTPTSMVAEVARFVRAQGSITDLDDLREMPAMAPQIFKRLAEVTAALPRETRLNLNTATDNVKRAVLSELPAEVLTEVMTRDTPIQSMGEIRRRVMEVLETEDIDHLKLDRLTVSSNWFEASLVAGLNGMELSRKVVFTIEQAEGFPVRLVRRKAVYD